LFIGIDRLCLSEEVALSPDAIVREVEAAKRLVVERCGAQERAVRQLGRCQLRQLRQLVVHSATLVAEHCGAQERVVRQLGVGQVMRPER
jgi:hypothetical protein